MPQDFHAGVARAKGYASRIYRSPGFRAAFVRGAQAAYNGSSRAACPYPASGQGWEVPWRNAWLRGFDFARKQ